MFRFLCHIIHFFPIYEALKTLPFLKLIYLSLHSMIYTNIAHALNVPSFKFLINLSHLQNVQFILFQRSLIPFSCFCKQNATYLRLQLEFQIEFLSYARLWSLDYYGKQDLLMIPTESSRTGLNLESVEAWKSIHPSRCIYLGASYPNVFLLRWHNIEMHHHVRI